MTIAGIAYLLREFSDKGVLFHMEAPYTDYEVLCPDGKVLSDLFSPAMMTIIDQNDLFFRCGLQGFTIKHHWMVCNECDEPQLLHDKYGAPSQKRRCLMTSKCMGIMRRIEPYMFEVVMPRKKRVTKMGTVVTPKELFDG